MSFVIPSSISQSKHMSVQAWCQRAYIRCHFNRPSKKKKGALMQKAIVSHGKTKMDHGEKERVTQRSSFKVVI
jgi:hypothetical protein